jgi:hypothetical protein
MPDSISMNSEDIRIGEVPSIDDLEVIEEYVDSSEREGQMFERFVQTELLKRFVDQDDRYDETRRDLNGNEFDYGEISGKLRSNFGKISGRVFRPEGRDISDRDLGRISGATTGNTMHNKAMNSYQSALENAGYELDDPDEQEIVETAEKALEEIENDSFSIDIENTTREAYGEAVKRIEQYR